MKWPGLKIVSGRRLAGFGPGTSFALDGDVVLHRENDYIPFSFSVHDTGTRHLGLWLGAGERVSVSEDGFTVDGVAAAAGTVLRAGVWRVALVDDVGPLPQACVLRGYAVARPLGVLMDRRGETSTFSAVWTDLHDPARVRVFTRDRVGGGRRPTTVNLDALRRSGDGVVDDAYAKAIALLAEANHVGWRIELDFSGEVGGIQAHNPVTALEHFARLVGQTITWNHEVETMRRRFIAADAVEPAALAALARSLAPERWQRECALREEAELMLASSPKLAAAAAATAAATTSSTTSMTSMTSTTASTATSTATLD